MAKYKCTVCGYVHEGDAAPAKCPQCTVPADKFVLIEEPKAAEAAALAAPAAAPAKKGLNTNSNVYTVCYAAVMVIIVAFLLAFISSSLKETQDANVLRDTKNQILTSLNMEGLSGEAIDQKYSDVVKDTVDLKGNKVTEAQLKEAEKNKEKLTIVFVAEVDNQTKYVLPVKGRGLWGGLWGYIAVNDDKATVYGTYFSHESETAGLGARINERWFQEQFNGKPIFDENGNVALTVVKAGTAAKETEVDGVTGATLTGKGVAAMVNDGLNEYKGFLNEK